MHYPFSLFARFSGSLLGLIFFLSAGTLVRAQLYWSGTGTWDTTSQNWGTVDGGPYDAAIWSNATPDSAIFQGTAGTVTLGEAITAGGLTFTTDGYLVTGNTLTLSGTPSITAGDGISATIGSDLVGAANVLVGGAGTITLNGTGTYTGQTMVRNGQFEIGSGASLSGTSRINALDDGELIVSGTVTVGDNGQFAIGMGEASAGTVTVASGGTLNIGNGSGGTVGFTGMGGRFLSSGSVGHGTLNIDGTVNLAAGGTGADGLDGQRFWLNGKTVRHGLCCLR